MPNRLAAALVAVLALVCASCVPAFAQTGGASWYQCCNPVTACNVPFRPSAMGAAHRTLPCGAKVRVTDTRSGRSVVVTILDRGPFVPGRVIDLYRGAAAKLGIIDRGVTRVTLQRLD
jgi:rare lipoprotein A